MKVDNQTQIVNRQKKKLKLSHTQARSHFKHTKLKMFIKPDEFSKRVVNEVRSMTTKEEYLTYIHHQPGFLFMNNDEMKLQMKEWKKHKVDCLKCNFRDYKINGQMFYGFVIQIGDIENNPMSPIAFSLEDVRGKVCMVDGYTYLAKRETNREAIWKYLGSKE